MILTAHQPVYFPWLGLFHKISLADKFCIFDIVKYQTKDFNNRNKIKTHAGPIWLSVPVESKNHLLKSIKDIKIINNGWNRKHFRSIYLAYSKAKYFEKYIGGVEEILCRRSFSYLVDLNFATLDYGAKSLGLNIEFTFASEHNFEGLKSDLVLDMCKKMKADDYIFGSQGRSYANIDSFLEHQITPHFQEYLHPVYTQLHGQFEPFMSYLDLLFNMGDSSLTILKSGNISAI